MSRSGAGAGCPAVLDVSAARSLCELTSLVDAVCRHADGNAASSVLVVHIVAATNPMPWPGAVGVQDVRRWERALRRMEGLALASVAVARAACGGPAMELLLAADYRISTPDLCLSLPVSDGLFWPGMAVHRMANQLGLAGARRLVLHGVDIDAADAMRLGLVDEIADDVDTAVRTAVDRLGGLPAAELAIRRRLLSEATFLSFDEALGVHLAACDRELRRVRHGQTTGHVAADTDTRP